jgi:bacilysin biosynthesis protein BacA
MILNNDNFWLRQTPPITSIATLGPEGSSSQCAARYLSSLIGEQLEVLLFNTFEQASEHVESNESCLLLVANAYQRVDNFYMNDRTLLLGSFFFAPPTYYLACKDISNLKLKVLSEKTISIASHHAPLSQLDNLIRSSEKTVFGIQKSQVEVQLTDSTSDGAQKTAAEIVDCCLANIDAINLNNLTVISHPLHIEMTWVVFSKNTITQKGIDNGKQQMRTSY